MPYTHEEGYYELNRIYYFIQEFKYFNVPPYDKDKTDKIISNFEFLKIIINRMDTKYFGKKGLAYEDDEQIILYDHINYRLNESKEKLQELKSILMKKNDFPPKLSNLNNGIIKQIDKILKKFNTKPSTPISFFSKVKSKTKKSLFGYDTPVLPSHINRGGSRKTQKQNNKKTVRKYNK